jgi:3-methyladenine DNA glycosylase AlkD
MTAFKVKAELKSFADSSKAEHSARFFKTGKGEYGEGDVFIGVTVPNQRKVAKQFKGLDLAEVKKLLDSKVHEHRLTALLILTYKYEKGDEALRRSIYDFYMRNLARVNNWDLVDSIAHKIVGDYLLGKPVMRKVLYNLARSKDLWERRVAMISTWWFIKYDQFDDVVKLAEILLKDEHDLMHKAVGWMLREMGKKDEDRLRKFLDKHAGEMPRTMLRYAIEKLDEDVRKVYMAK